MIENTGLVIVPSEVKLSLDGIKAILITGESTVYCATFVKVYPENEKNKQYIKNNVMMATIQMQSLALTLLFNFIKYESL